MMMLASRDALAGAAITYHSEFRGRSEFVFYKHVTPLESWLFAFFDDFDFFLRQFI